MISSVCNRISLGDVIEIPACRVLSDIFSFGSELIIRHFVFFVCTEDEGNLGQWKSQSTAKALEEMKENNTPLAAASRKVGGPGNTLRSSLIIDSVRGRHIRK
jgi:hypothetical protein